MVNLVSVSLPVKNISLINALTYLQYSKQQYQPQCNAGMNLLGGVHTPPSPGQVGCRGGCYFHDKAEKYERHNEIHVIVICHTVSEYHV